MPYAGWLATRPGRVVVEASSEGERVPGYLLPRLVREVPGATAKTPLTAAAGVGRNASPPGGIGTGDR